MHRDTRTGLALGILLVGIVGALFFRDESQAIPQLEDPQSLDAEIAEKPFVPYLVNEPGDADHEEANSADTAQRAPFASQSPPDPIPLTQQAANSNIIVPIRNSSDNTSGQSSPEKRALQSRETEPSTVAVRYHLVEPGDTLTSLAVTYLGDSSRYPEIYRLNRGVLNDPNNLPVGVKIRIPRKLPNRNAKDQPKQKRVSAAEQPVQQEMPALAENAIQGVSEETDKASDTTAPAAHTAHKSHQILLHMKNSAEQSTTQQNQTVAEQPPVAKRFVPVKQSPFGSRRILQQN